MPKTTRRRFLEQSLFAAAGAAAAALPGQPSNAFEELSGRPASPNETIRVACIGVRGQGGGHVNAYSSMKDSVVAAICDVDVAIGQGRCDGVEKKTGQRPQYYQDIRKLLEDKSIDAVSIATPNHWHALAAIWAMQAGKDVYVEKPVSHNVSEGRRIVQATRSLKRICQTGTQCRSSDGLTKAIEYIRSGKLGDVKLARGLCYKSRGSIGKTAGPQEPPATMDYNLWCGPAPFTPPQRNGNFGPVHYDWHWIWDYGNGDLGNQGIHQMDIARWGLGEAGLAKAALSLGGRFGYIDDGETPNTQIVYLDYGQKQLIFEVRGLKSERLKGAGVGVIFYGSDGYIVNPSYNASTVFDLQGKEIATFKDPADVFTKHVRNFLAAVRSRKTTDLNADIEEGHISSALCHLGNVSYRLGSLAPFGSPKAIADKKDSHEAYERFEKHLADNGIKMETSQYTLGRRLTVDVTREVFVDDPEANAMLTRNYREPFVVPATV